MKINKKQLLIAAALLIALGVVIFGIGRALFQGDEGSNTMENQSYMLSEVKRIQINTDSPSVVIKPVSGDQVNLTWQTGEYVEYQAKMTNGELAVDYRTSTNWLKSLLLAPLTKNEYVLEVELPDGYQGGLVIHTASGSITVQTPAALDEAELTTVSGSIDASDIDSREGIEVRSTSGSVSVETVRAAGDIHIQTVSGSVKFHGSTALGGIELQTTSGGITASGLNAADGFRAKTTSGKVDVSQIKSDADVSLDSASGSLKPSDVICRGFTAKTVSGSIGLDGLTAITIEMKSTSGSIHGTISGSREEYGMTVHTVSGSSNLASASGNSDKTLKINTVSGSIDLQFSGAGE